MAAWRAAIELLSGLPNVAIKLSGFGMFDRQLDEGVVAALVHRAIDCFGPDRVMFGSNFPVDGLMRDYASLWRAYDEIT